MSTYKRVRQQQTEEQRQSVLSMNVIKDSRYPPMQVFNYHATMKPGEGAGVGGGGGGGKYLTLSKATRKPSPCLLFSNCRGFQLPRVFFYLRSPGRGPRACLVFVKKTDMGWKWKFRTVKWRANHCPYIAFGLHTCSGYVSSPKHSGNSTHH